MKAYANGGKHFVISDGPPRDADCIATMYKHPEAAKRARLFAAAPDLLEAAKAILETLQVQGGCFADCTEDTPCDVCYLGEAILKAEGRGVSK